PPSHLHSFPTRRSSDLVRQLDAQNRGLERVEACVPAKVLVMVLRLHAMHAQAGHSRRPLGVVGHHHPGVAVGPEVLGWIETETADRKSTRLNSSHLVIS